MKFQLLKNMRASFFEDRRNYDYDILRTPKTAHLQNSVSPFTPISSKKDGSDPIQFWDMKDMEKCQSALIQEINKEPRSLDLYIEVKLKSPRNGEYTVKIRDCTMLTNLYRVCGAKAQFIVEIHFLTLDELESKAELITQEFHLGQDAPDRNVISGQDFFVEGTKQMKEYWESQIDRLNKWIHLYNVAGLQVPSIDALVSVTLVVEDDLKLFKNVLKKDPTPRILERGADFDILIAMLEGPFKIHREKMMECSEFIRKAFAGKGMSQIRKASQYSGILVLEGNTHEKMCGLFNFVNRGKLPLDNHEIMLELLKMSKQYKIARLQDAVVKALMEKEATFFTKEFAARVFQAAMIIPRADMLKKKMAKIIASEGPINLGMSRVFREDLNAMIALIQREEEAEERANQKS